MEKEIQIKDEVDEKYTPCLVLERVGNYGGKMRKDLCVSCLTANECRRWKEREENKNKNLKYMI